MTSLPLIATPGADDHTASGILVFWTVEGGPCSHDALIEELQDTEAVGDDDLPRLPSDSVAFHRALQQFEGPSRFLRARKPRGSGFFIVDEAQDGESLELATNLRLQLKDGQVSAEGADPEGLVPQVQIEYEVQTRRMTGRDVSLWMVERCKALNAVPLRPSGGTYFVPRARMAAWRRIAGAVEAGTEYRVFELPVMHTDEAVEAVLESVLREAKTESETIAADIRSGKLGARALHTRAKQAEALAVKVGEYEALLGREIENYRLTFETLEGASVRAALKAEADAEAAKAAKGAKGGRNG